MIVLPNDKRVDSKRCLVGCDCGPVDVGVLLMNMGGPDDPASVEPFLRNLFNDRGIIQLPGGRIGQRLLADCIVRLRVEKVKRAYARLGGGSPLLAHTRGLAGEVYSELVRRLNGSLRLGVGVAMRYWHPFADEGVRQMLRLGVRRVVAISLYPQYSHATTGSSIRDLEDAAERLGLNAQLVFIDRFFDAEQYLALWAERLEDALMQFGEDRRYVQLVVSAHGLPRRCIEAGDPYLSEVKATMRGVLERMSSPPPAHLAFQSRVGPVRWLQPSTQHVLAALARAGHRHVLVWPISFVSDHIETSYELAELIGTEARERGIEDYRVVPAFNADVKFAGALADLLLPYVVSERGGS